MSRPRDILGMLESGFLKNEGAAFGGLLHVGDRRVCKLLQPLRESLDKDSFKVAIHCSTGFIHSAVVDFYLNWLEGLVGDDDDGLFGAVAQGLLLHKKSCGGDEIFTGDRPFPASSVSPKQSREMRKPIPLSEYSTKVAPRFYALERSEPPPRIMPYVLREWGFEPVTDSTDAAALDDRFRTA